MQHNTDRSAEATMGRLRPIAALVHIGELISRRIAMDAFKQTVVEYARLEAALGELNARAKALREQKQGLADGIISFMANNNIDCCNLPDDSRLVLRKQVQISPINKEYIEETLADFFKTPLPRDSQKMAEETTHALLTNRDVTERPTLKILKKK